MLLPVLRKIHRWLGLLLALPLLVQGVTGTILTCELLLPDRTASGASTGTPHDAGAIIAAAQAGLPSGLRPSRYLPAASPGETALVAFVPASGPPGRGPIVRIDPVTLAALDTSVGTGFFDWVKTLHTNLLIEGRTGRSVIGWVGVGLLALTALGLVVWWPMSGRWRAALTIDPRAAGYPLHRRLHGAVGFWTVALLLMTAGTGVLLAFPQTARAAFGLADNPQRRSGRSAEAPVVDIERAIALGSATAQGLRVRAVFLPAGATDPVRIMLVPPQTDGIAAMVTVSVDAAGSRVLAVQDPRAMPAAELALRWVHDLHFGQGLGPVWRCLTVVTGLVVPIFAVTGTAMWLYRRQRRSPVLQPGD